MRFTAVFFQVEQPHGQRAVLHRLGQHPGRFVLDHRPALAPERVLVHLDHLGVAEDAQGERVELGHVAGFDIAGVSLPAEFSGGKLLEDITSVVIRVKPEE